MPRYDNYPLYSEEMLTIAREAIDKDKNLLPVTNVQRVDIPPNMTAEHWRELKILPGHRIGWEYKQQYIDKLSELYSEGFLTQEEYDKRVEWVNDAQTSEQIDIAFMDLQSSLPSVKAKQYLQPKQSDSKAEIALPAAIFILLMLCVTVEGVAGAWIGFFILLGEMFAVSLIVGSYLRREKRKKKMS